MLCLIAFGVALYFFVSGPKSSDPIEYSAKNSDSNNGEYIYIAAGCSSCHVAEGSENKYLSLIHI